VSLDGSAPGERPEVEGGQLEADGPLEERGLVMGIDGGASRTRLLLAGRSAAPLARSEMEGSLLEPQSEERVGRSLVEAIRTLVESVDIVLPVESVCVGLAGSGSRPGARAVLEAHLLKEGVSRRVMIVSDADIAHADAFGEAPGILLVAGTGSIGVARAPADGAGAPLHRVGGWGALVGDEGSGYRLGLEGIRAAIRGMEGRGPATALSRLIPEMVGVEGAGELFLWAERADKSEIGALGPEVAGEGERGDAVAGRLVDEATEGVVAHALALRRRLFAGSTVGSLADRVPTAMTGGLLDPGGPLREPVSERLRSEGLDVHQDRVDPARGAVRLALLSAARPPAA
jgi:glucosamine kinase